LIYVHTLPGKIVVYRDAVFQTPSMCLTGKLMTLHADKIQWWRHYTRSNDQAGRSTTLLTALLW